MLGMHSPGHQPGREPIEATGPRSATHPMRVLAPSPKFLPPLEGESAMLLHLLGQAFTDLMEGA